MNFIFQNDSLALELRWTVAASRHRWQWWRRRVPLLDRGSSLTWELESPTIPSSAFLTETSLLASRYWDWWQSLNECLNWLQAYERSWKCIYIILLFVRNIVAKRWFGYQKVQITGSSLVYNFLVYLKRMQVFSIM